VGVAVSEPVPAPGPVLRVVNPDATPEEIAALVAVFSAMGGAAEPEKKPKPEWSAHYRKLRSSLPHGRGAWRASGLPR
jgi:hypothetical protein